MTSIVGLTELLNVTVTPAPGSVQDTNLKQVAGNAVDTGVGASTGGTQRVALSTDSTVKIVDGSTTPITGSLSNNGTLISTDTLGYNSISVQLSGAWEAEVTFQASNDNVNWVNVQGYAFNSTMSAIDMVADNDIYVFPVIGRYFQAVVSGYVSGPVSATAYLRSQSLAGIGEAALTQAMDQANGTPINVGFQGFQGPGQQNAANSLPVALANEQVLDKFISGRVWQNVIPVNTNICLDSAAVANNPLQPLDCLQYRSISIQVIQPAAATGGAITFEGSNDTINWTTLPLYSAANNQYGAQSTSYGVGTAGGQIVSYEGPLYLRYFRARVSTAFAGTPGAVYVNTRLSMAPYTKYSQSAVNLTQQNGNGLAGGTTMTNAGTLSSAFPALVVGGSDRSVVRSELLGAPYNQLSSYTNGPYARNAYYDLAGAAGVAGPQPFLAEDKTYPVNVRLERTTNGQESVQDMLRQILVELKALSYYTRELPMAISSLNQTPSPSIFGMPSSMADDPENLYNDQTLFDYRKGN